MPEELVFLFQFLQVLLCELQLLRGPRQAREDLIGWGAGGAGLGVDEGVHDRVVLRVLSEERRRAGDGVLDGPDLLLLVQLQLDVFLFEVCVLSLNLLVLALERQVLLPAGVELGEQLLLGGPEVL